MIFGLILQYTKTQTQNTNTMTTSKNVQKMSKFYNNLLAHCNKQYKNVAQINKAYIVNGQVFGIDYISTDGLECLSSNTAIAESVITFN